MSKKAFTTADDILKLVSLSKIIEVNDIPEVEGTFYLRTISDREREDFEMAGLSDDGSVNVRGLRGYRSRLLAMTLVDADGKRLFPNGKASSLSDLPAYITVPLYEHAERINQLGEYSKKVDEELGDALKKA